MNHMTDGLIWALLRWVAILALGIFLARLILRVFALFLEEMGVWQEKPVPKDSTPGENPTMPEEYPRPRNLRPGVWIEANWGGLGGGLSGWRVSNAIIYFLLMSLLLGCLSLAVFSLAPAPERKGDAKKEEAQPEQKSGTGKKDDQKKEADKKDDKNAAKQGEPTHSDRKPDETKTPESSTGDMNLKKSSNAPAAGKKTEQ